MKHILLFMCSLILNFSLAACGSNAENQQPSVSITETVPIEIESIEQINTDKQIQITTKEGDKIIFQLNNSPAADEFYNQLPLFIQAEDYAGSEKIFYLPEELNTSNTPMAQGPVGTLAYYEPWGNVAIFYGECGGASGLYELGEVIFGTEFIAKLNGEIQIEAVLQSSALLETAELENTSAQQTQPPIISSEEHPSVQNSKSVSTQQTQPLTLYSEETSVLQETESEISFEENNIMQMNVQVGDTMFSATLEKNTAVDAFVELMKTAPIVIQMSDYSRFEKVGSLGTNLPASNNQTTTQSGDIVLYNGNQIVIFYGSNSWSYTRIGKINDLTGWKEALGAGDVTVIFSVD